MFSQKQLSENQKLVSVAKIWGFLKYYHPEIANGNYNWDDELFKILPTVRNCNNKEELSRFYLTWIDEFGEIKRCKKCGQLKNYKYFNKNFDLKWLSDQDLFTEELSDQLKHIELNRHQGKKHFVSVGRKRIGNVEITNEITYEGFNWENENLRLLTLFRYWNIIAYFFPYKYQTDSNWDEVLKEMIPKFSNPKNETEFHLAMLELIVNIDDSHGQFYTRLTEDYFGKYWIPAKLEFIDDGVFITEIYNDSLAKVDDLQIGDRINKIDNQEVSEIFKHKEKYIFGSNISRKKASAKYYIFNGATTSIDIQYTRNNKTQTKTINRYVFKDLNHSWQKELDTYQILDGNIGFVNLGRIKIKEIPKVMDKLKDTKAIILDLRYYPKGTHYILSKYISSSKRDFYKVIYPDLDYPGRFIWRNGKQCGQNGELIYKGKVVLLVNEDSQSQAEFAAMCLQKGNDVTTIGSQTSGADGNVSKFKMVGGYRTMISGIGIFYADETEAQRTGVKIDIDVKPTVQGIIEGKDEVLEKAIDYINQ